MPNILDQIVETKRLEVAEAKGRVPQTTLELACEQAGPTRGFSDALFDSSRLAVIAEIKKASPSAGLIRADFDPVAIGQEYQAHGASCLSVLTDEKYFQGHLDFLRAVRAAVTLPLLRKEFIIDAYQLYEARAAGADAILLIAECLPGDELNQLYQQARRLQLDVLIELHEPEQLARVLDTGTNLLGINNRNLKTFETRLEHTLDLLPKIPDGVAVISESGIRTAADMKL